MMIAVVISLSLNLWLIPSLGFVGSIRTLTVVHLFLAAALFPAAFKALPLSFPPSFAVRWAGFSTVVALGAFFSAPLLVSAWSTIIGLVIATLSLILLVFLLRFHRVIARGNRADIFVPECVNP
jgi:hypothetical protein